MATPDLTTVPLDVMGVRVDLTLAGTGRAELEKAVAAAWDRCTATGIDGDPGRGVQVVLDPDPDVVREALDAGHVAGESVLRVMDELTSRLVREGLEAIVGDRLLLHACALADPTSGATAVLVAPSGTGKTTASQTLARTLGYVTDETAVIERDGTLKHFPKPLSLLVDGTRPKRQVSPTELGMLPAPAAPWLARIAYLARDSEADGVRVERVSTVEGLALLAEQTSSLHLLSSPLATLAALLEAQGGLIRLVYAEAADLAPVLQTWLADASPLTLAPPLTDTADTDAAGASPESAPAREGADTPSGTRIRRLPVIDELMQDGAMAVMLPGQVLALSSLAAFVLLIVGDCGGQGMEIVDLEQVLGEELPHPDGISVAEALRPMLDDLVTRGLLEHC